VIEGTFSELGDTWAWSYQQKLSDLRNFQKKSEIFKPAVFARKVRKIK
jgi:hypothetical protein